jgi:hypothetical protein
MSRTQEKNKTSDRSNAPGDSVIRPRSNQERTPGFRDGRRYILAPAWIMRYILVNTRSGLCCPTRAMPRVFLDLAAHQRLRPSPCSRLFRIIEIWPENPVAVVSPVVTHPTPGRSDLLGEPRFRVEADRSGPIGPGCLLRSEDVFVGRGPSGARRPAPNREAFWNGVRMNAQTWQYSSFTTPAPPSQNPGRLFRARRQCPVRSFQSFFCFFRSNR